MSSGEVFEPTSSWCGPWHEDGRTHSNAGEIFLGFTDWGGMAGSATGHENASDDKECAKD